MTVQSHFEKKDIQAIRGLVYDKLNKISLDEDLNVVKSALKALIKRQTPNSNLSSTFATRVYAIQEIIDEPSMWGISPDKIEAFHQLIFECLREKMIFFKEKQKQLVDLANRFEQQMLSKIEKELIWIAPEKLCRVGKHIKSEALKQARHELSNSQRIEAEITIERQKELQDKIKELGSRIPTTEKFYESVKRQLEEGRIGASWSMESLFGHESVITHYLVKNQILSKEDFLHLTVYEFVLFGSKWLKPIYKQQKEQAQQLLFTVQQVRDIAQSEPKLQKIKEIHYFDGKLADLGELLRDYTDDKDVILEAIKQDGNALKYAHEKFRADREVVLEAVIQDEMALQYASDELRNDRELVLEVIDREGLILEFVSDELKNDRELAIRAVSQDGWALEFVSDELKNDKKLVLIAVRRDGWALQHASRALRRDRKVVVEAVKQDGLALEFASKKFRKDRKVVLKAIRQNGEALEFASKILREDPKLISIAIKQNGLAYKYISKNFKSDRNIILKAVRQNGLALELLAKDLRNDRELVLEAIRQNGEALKYASNALKKDKRLVLEAIKQNRRAYVYVADELKLDNDLLTVVKHHQETLQQASSRVGVGIQ